jgi:hypothetical protein
VPASFCSAAARRRTAVYQFRFDNQINLYNITYYCYMNRNSLVRLVGALLDLIDDLISDLRSRMIATHLIRSVAVTVAKYRATQGLGSGTRPVSKMCLVLEEAGASGAWRERMERRRLSRRLEPVRQAILVADEIIEKTFPSRRAIRHLPRSVMMPTVGLPRAFPRGSFPPPR